MALTLKQCAEKMGLHAGTIRRYVKENKLKGQPMYPHSHAPIVVEEEELARFMALIAKPDPAPSEPIPPVLEPIAGIPPPDMSLLDVKHVVTPSPAAIVVGVKEDGDLIVAEGNVR